MKIPVKFGSNWPCDFQEEEEIMWKFLQKIDENDDWCKVMTVDKVS